MKMYYEGLNEKLYAAIPPALRVLELGCAAGRLGERYKHSHPETTWVGVDCSEEALQAAAQRLDAVFRINLDDESLERVGEAYDCVVMGDLLEHLKQPEKILAKLTELTTPNASLVCCVPNMGHVSVIERMLLGDLAYDDQGLLDRTHLRFLSCSSLFKMLLDSGWLPTLRDSYLAGSSNSALVDKLTETARLMSVPEATAKRLLFTYQMVVQCKKRVQDAATAVSSSLAVVVPVNNETKLQLDILKSPGLAELNAPIFACSGADSAARAFNWGVSRSHSQWLIFCHQDVYFPKGSGHAIANILSKIPEAEGPRTILGFAGLAVKQNSGQLDLAKAGLVVDRVNLFDYPESNSAVSIDEFAVVIHRKCNYEIDPRLGWHLWATDLCLQAIFDKRGRNHAHVVRVPLFHNSLCDGSLPPAFRESAATLAAKHAQLAFIPTLCGNISAVPNSLLGNAVQNQTAAQMAAAGAP